MRSNPHYDLGGVAQRLAIIMLVFAAMYVSRGALFLAVVPVVVMAMFKDKPDKVFFWILVTVCALACNRTIAPKGMVFAIAQRGMLIIIGGIMALRFFTMPAVPLVRLFLPMILYLLFMVIPSARGWDPKISFLKLFLFGSVYLAYLGVINMVARGRRLESRNIRMIILAVAVVFLVGSLALIPFPAIGQLKQEDYVEGMTSLFCGMTMHSQSLGPVVSSLSVILFSDLLFSIKRFDWLYVFLLALCPYLVYLTSSRTGMGAYLLGMFYAFYLFANARQVTRNWKSKVVTCGFALICVLSIVLLFGSSARQKVEKFALKWDKGGESLSAEALMSSRQVLIDRALDNFKKKPLYGNGFQVSMYMEGRKRETLGSILSAPIEKGVWVVAVLEEGGVIGWVLFVSFLLGAIIGTAKRRAYISSACLFTFTVTNLGEFTFFSMSYTGGFAWAMVFAGLAMDVSRLKEERLAQECYYGMLPRMGLPPM